MIVVQAFQKAERERIFEKFAQVERVERRGAGLGLTFCKMVVETHGGYLVVNDSPTWGRSVLHEPAFAARTRPYG